MEQFISTLKEELVGKVSTVIEIDNIVQEIYRKEYDNIPNWNCFTSGDVKSYFENRSYTYENIGQDFDKYININFEIIKKEENICESTIKIVDIYEI